MGPIESHLSSYTFNNHLKMYLPLEKRGSLDKSLGPTQGPLHPRKFNSKISWKMVGLEDDPASCWVLGRFIFRGKLAAKH